MLYQADGILVESFDVTNGTGSANGRLSIAGNQVTINPNADLSPSTGYTNSLNSGYR
jgi:hypothetical protein